MDLNEYCYRSLYDNNLIVFYICGVCSRNGIILVYHRHVPCNRISIGDTEVETYLISWFINIFVNYYYIARAVRGVISYSCAQVSVRGASRDGDDDNHICIKDAAQTIWYAYTILNGDYRVFTVTRWTNLLTRDNRARMRTCTWCNHMDRSEI